MSAILDLLPVNDPLQAGGPTRNAVPPTGEGIDTTEPYRKGGFNNETGYQASVDDRRASA
jgi:hypothetical protein